MIKQAFFVVIPKEGLAGLVQPKPSFAITVKDLQT